MIAPSPAGGSPRSMTDPTCSAVPAFARRSLNLSFEVLTYANGVQLSHVRRDVALTGAPATSNRKMVTVRTDGAKKTNAKRGFRTKSPMYTNVIIVGAFVLMKMVTRAYNVVAISREKSRIGGKSDKEKKAN